MKCGDLGFRNAQGKPCGYAIAAAAKGCPHHSPVRADRRRAKVFQQKGALMAQMKRALPADYRMPLFDSRESLVQFAQDLAKRVLTEDVDPRRVDTALRAAGVALSAFAAATQEKLVDALLKIEHGGAAMMLLTRLQDGLTEGRRRPLPGRAALTIPEGSAS